MTCHFLMFSLFKGVVITKKGEYGNIRISERKVAVNIQVTFGYIIVYVRNQ